MDIIRDDGSLPLESILQSLCHIRDKLVEINEKNGNLASYFAMRKEIEALGWNGILLKYHPDINVEDPAAFPRFELYKFIYSTMQQGKGPQPPS